MVDEKDDEILSSLTMPQQIAITKLIDTHGSVQYLLQEFEKMQLELETTKIQLSDMATTIEENKFGGRRRKLLTGEEVSMLLPSTAVRHIRKWAIRHIETTANNGKAARWCKDTEEIVLNLSDPYFQPLLEELHVKLYTLKQKLRESIKHGILPKPYHRAIMEWDTNPPYSVVIPGK